MNFPMALSLTLAAMTSTASAAVGNWTALSPERLQECGNEFDHGFTWDGHEYLFEDDHQEWWVAAAVCQSCAGYLADILSAAESEFLHTALAEIDNQNHFWLGGHNEDGTGMVWLSGAAFEFEDFVAAKANTEPYLHLQPQTGYRWNTKTSADTNNGFICKY